MGKIRGEQQIVGTPGCGSFTPWSVRTPQRAAEVGACCWGLGLGGGGGGCWMELGFVLFCFIEQGVKATEEDFR